MPQDSGQASQWYTLAFQDGGNWAGQAALGLGRLAEAAGDATDLAQAAEWYQRAAALGVEEAQQALDRLKK